ncbi:MAG: 1-acyl-sn-glycerol-3-phosphate acyltransferase [Drouetiella hepatica Uher 2000/2452]|uniref:1-acyl-sn-glycerol-3-phosphate acyltransferase n=1 Tax=Drouetiella hepatica Uher 2000/2452 TaxID=904376 RepID=A0A951QAK3_9CYAN|nr:1-acyl-sn-glycerol-3-phosphate acyltransferase [Drouetiella hepatica Uher 2000/2452]
MTRLPFYPPKINPFLVWMLQQASPWIARWIDRLELVVSAEPEVPIATLQQQPCLLLCNHSTFQDEVVLFLLSARVGQPFYYLAAHERFQGIRGWFYQRIGAYSVRRGLADRESVRQTLSLVTRPGCKLVVFPEGGCSFQNDTVMPFRSGAVQIALQALARLDKRSGSPGSSGSSGSPSSPDLPDLYAVPISLKYRYTGKMSVVIQKTLNRLEKAIALPPAGDVYQRLRTIAEHVLVNCEQEYGLPSPLDLNWNQRITRLKAQVLQQCEAQLKLTFIKGEPDRERVYRIRHALENRSSTLMPDGTDGWDVMLQATARVLNFDAIYDGYVSEKPTPERFLDTLIRLEREVFKIDQPHPKGYRQAYLRIGKPINLKDHVADYRRDRSATVNQVIQQLHGTVQRNLDVLSEATARGISW